MCVSHYPDIILQIGPLIRLSCVQLTGGKVQIVKGLLKHRAAVFPNIQVEAQSSNFKEKLYSHGIQQALSRMLASRKNNTQFSAVLYKNTLYSKGLVLAVGVRGILFGKMVLI